MLEFAKFIRKAKAPMAIGSGAQMPMDMRDPGELASFGRLLGLQDNEINDGFSGKMALENRKRLSGKWIMPGVEVE
jgi:RNase P/RNase MRP subunit p30